MNRMILSFCLVFAFGFLSACESIKEEKQQPPAVDENAAVNIWGPSKLIDGKTYQMGITFAPYKSVRAVNNSYISIKRGEAITKMYVKILVDNKVTNVSSYYFRPFELGIKSESGNSDYNGTYAYGWGVITAEGVSDVESLATPSGDSLVFGNNGNFATLKYTWSSDIARHIIEPPIVFEVNIQVVDNF